MSNEIAIRYVTGKTLYALMYNSANGEVWNTVTSAFETYATANLGNYDIPLTEEGTASARYVGTVPTAVPAADLDIDVMDQAGSSPAESDTLAGTGKIPWNGSARVDTGVLFRVLQAMCRSDVSAPSEIGGTFNPANDALQAIDSDLRTRIGSVSDTGIDSLFGHLHVLARSDTAAPANFNLAGGTFDPSTDSLEAIRNNQATVESNIRGADSDDLKTISDQIDVLPTDTAATISDAVWDEATSDHVTAGSFGKAVGDIDTTTSNTNTTVSTIDSTTSTISANVSTLLSRITATLFSGITSLANWLRVLARKDGADATALSEIAGTYNDTTDSLEAIRDRGDAAWITGTVDSLTGTGSETVTLTIKDDNGVVLPDVDVWFTTDAAGNTKVAGTLKTDSFGIVNQPGKPQLDPGTYYVWRQKSGENFTNPQTITVVAS